MQDLFPGVSQGSTDYYDVLVKSIENTIEKLKLEVCNLFI